MRLRKFCCLASAVALSSLTVFSAMFGVTADAAGLSVELSPVETLSLYGNTIDAAYCLTPGTYMATTFEYVGYVSGIFSGVSYNRSNDGGTSVKNVLGSVDIANSYTYLVYSCSDVAYSATASSIDFQIQLKPVIDLNTSFLSTSLLFSTASGSNYYTTYRPFWLWSIDDTETKFTPNYTHNSTYDSGNCYFSVPAGDFSFGDHTNTATSYFCGIPVYISSDDPVHVVSNNVNIYRSIQVEMDGIDYKNYYILVQCPIVSDDFVIVGGGGSGSGSSSPDINVDVNVDMSETNGLLGKLLEAFQGFVSGILEGIKNLFVPSEEALTGFQTDMQAALSEHLGGLYEALEVITDSFSGLGDVVARETLYVPETVIPLVDSSFTIGPWEIPLKVDDNRFSFVYESVAFIIDFIFTVAFVNMLRNKLEIFLNPESEVITE